MSLKISKQTIDTLWIVLLVVLITAILAALFVPAVLEFVNRHHGGVFICLMIIVVYTCIFLELRKRKK